MKKLTLALPIAALAACTFSSCVYDDPSGPTRVVQGQQRVYYDNGRPYYEDGRPAPSTVVVRDRDRGYNDPNVVVVNNQRRYAPQPARPDVVVVKDHPNYQQPRKQPVVVVDHKNNPPREVRPEVGRPNRPQPVKKKPVVVVDDKKKKKNNDDQNDHN